MIHDALPASVLGFDHVQIAAPRTPEVESRARAFYGGVLGLTEIPKPQVLATRGGAWFRCGDRSLHIGLDAEFQPAHKAHPAFLVSDLDTVRARLEAAGYAIQIDVQLPGYRRFETRDPFGNRLELMERTSSPADSVVADRDAIKSRVREQFGRTADAYVQSSDHTGGHDLDRLVELAHLQPTDLALDVSTGGGHTALALAPHVARVTVSDFTPTMLAAARRFLTAQGVANAEYVIADAEQLPFLPESFDLVTVRIAPHHYTDVRAAAREFARVLRPGGRLLLIDNIAPDDPDLDAFVNDIERRRDPSHVKCYTESEWRDVLARAGLDVTHMEVDHKSHDFAKWTARSQMPDSERASLERDMLTAPAAARARFRIEVRDDRVLSWTSEALILRAVKPV